MALWGGFAFEAISQCEGMLGSYHISLLLPETGGEYAGYASDPDFECERLGYFPAGGTGTAMATSVQFYRHRSPFDATGVGDNMWSADSLEGHDLYDTHGASFRVPFGESP